MDKLEITTNLLSKKLDRIKLLMDTTDESIELMLSNYAASTVKCTFCPLRAKCRVRTNPKTCSQMWLEFLEASDE